MPKDFRLIHFTVYGQMKHVTCLATERQNQSDGKSEDCVPVIGIIWWFFSLFKHADGCLFNTGQALIFLIKKM